MITLPCGCRVAQACEEHAVEALDKPVFRMPHFKYTGPARILTSVDVDMDAEVVIVGQPENGAYEWVIVNHGQVRSHSDCGYGMKSIALRDGLIAFHGNPRDEGQS